MRTDAALGSRHSADGDEGSPAPTAESREPTSDRREPLDAEDEAIAPEVLLLRIGDQEWALPATAAQEVVRWRPATRVPGAPSWVVGLVNLRGAVVPVADLTFRLSGRPVNRAAGWIVLVEDGARRGGFLVCMVRDVRTVAESLPDAPTPAGAPARGAVRVARTEGEAEEAAVPLLDPAILLDELTAEGDR